MGENKELSTEQLINRAAKKSANEAAKVIMEELKSKNLIKSEMSYYKRVEILLYNYENLKEAVKQKEEDIRDIEVNGLPNKSKSIVVYSSSSGGISAGERYTQLIEKYKVEKTETERDLRRIENALDKIKVDKYYKIIELKYLSKEEDKIGTDENLAEKLEKDRSTITRNRKRLMNKLITVLFPNSIRDVI
jgi:hypothetical protein